MRISEIRPRRLAVIAVLLLIGAPFAAAQGPQTLGAEDLETLHVLTRALDADGGLHVAQAAGPESCPVTALRSAILYRHAAQQHEETLFQALRIDDYAARAAGGIEPVTRQAFMRPVRAVDTAYPQLQDARIKLAIAFCDVRDENIWTQTGQGPLSLSRFLRGALVGMVWSGSEVDGVAVLNAIDERTRAMQAPN